jgi:hypothetical protein
MNLSAVRPTLGNKPSPISRVRSGAVYGLIIILALIAFEVFNFSTTVFALRDLLGDLKFAGIPWSTFLALAFCGIDFAGIARLINPETRTSDLKESWYLFGAWLLAATANAALTWWGVAVAISNHLPESATVISTNTLTHIVPVFIAILVWVIRILIIASLTSAIERLTEHKPAGYASQNRAEYTHPASATQRATPVSAHSVHLTRQQRPSTQARPEPTYHDVFAGQSFSNYENNNHSKNL